MKPILAFLAFIVSCANVYSQSITGTNLAHLYDPGSGIAFRMKLVNGVDSVNVLYELHIRNAASAEDYEIAWEKRESYGQRKGDPITQPVKMFSAGSEKIAGQLTFVRESKPWLLVATVTNKSSLEVLMYFKQIDPNYPIDGYLLQNGKVCMESFVTDGTGIALSSQAVVFRYPQHFQAASPPFAEKDNKLNLVMQADSIFQAEPNVPLGVTEPGLYLVQKDSSSAKGFSFMVVSSPFPRYAKMEDLTDPLIFICTKEEFEELRNAGGDKVKFDKVILEITNDKERAKNFMRNYFRRVELANHYFTAFKEGWKTDRGMIYMIFGPPDEVTHTGDSEAWNYKNHKVRFTFVKSGSVYDPDNYVLLRDKRFGETWYNTIDLWRKGRL